MKKLEIKKIIKFERGMIDRRKKYPKIKLKYRKLLAYKLLVICNVALFLAIIIPIIIVSITIHDAASWLQRSSVIIISLCIYIELKLIIIKARLNQKNVTDLEVLKIILKLQTWQKRCSILSKSCLFFALFLLGYGDLIYD